MRHRSARWRRWARGRVLASRRSSGGADGAFVGMVGPGARSCRFAPIDGAASRSAGGCREHLGARATPARRRAAGSTHGFGALGLEEIVAFTRPQPCAVAGGDAADRDAARSGARLRASGAAGGPSAAAASVVFAHRPRDGPMPVTRRAGRAAMRVIVYGVGAIGGTVAAALALAGQEVVGIARGAQLDGDPSGRAPAADAGRRGERPRFACVGDPGEIDCAAGRRDPADDEDAGHRAGAGAAAGGGGWRSSRSSACRTASRTSGWRCGASRTCTAVTVMMPATFTVPGEVVAFVDAAARHLRHRALSRAAATTRRPGAGGGARGGQHRGLRQRRR